MSIALTLAQRGTRTRGIERVSVVGLGKLGSPIVASFASCGYETVGLDINPVFVEALATHQAPVNEPGLQELINQHKERIFATLDWNELVSRSDATFLVVPTPSNRDGGFSNRFVLDACKKLGTALRYKNEFHLVVVVSTMMPGSSEKEIVPALEWASRKKVAKGFGYCYSPTLIALGNVIQNFLNPDLIMIGATDPSSGELLESFYRTVVGERPAIHRVNPTEAELAKISINTFVTTKISFANMLGMVAEGLGRVDVDRVTHILGSDSRIGPKYLKAGGSYGGPCFPRDNRAFSRVAELAGVDTHIPQATDATNRALITNIARKVKAVFAGVPGQVGIVGAAYKLDTDVVEEAMGICLASLLATDGFKVVLYDALAIGSARKALGDSVTYAESLEECFRNSRVIVITNPYPFMVSEMTAAMAAGKLIIDCWRILPDGRSEGRPECSSHREESIPDLAQPRYAPRSRATAASNLVRPGRTA
jgi:UDPglucose 6-dehydrogenase